MSSAGFKGVEGPAGPLVNENFVTLLKGDFNDYMEEIERLRQQNAELKKVNEFLNHKLSEAIKEINPLIIAKARGGE